MVKDLTLQLDNLKREKLKLFESERSSKKVKKVREMNEAIKMVESRTNMIKAILGSEYENAGFNLF